MKFIQYSDVVVKLKLRQCSDLNDCCSVSEAVTKASSFFNAAHS